MSTGRILSNLKSAYGLQAETLIQEFTDSQELNKLLNVASKMNNTETMAASINQQQKFELLTLFPNSDEVKHSAIYSSILESICSELHLKKSDLPFNSVVEVIERSLKLYNNRDLQNKVRDSVTEYSKSHNFKQIDS